MIIFLKKHKYIIPGILFVISVLPLFYHSNTHSEYATYKDELYKPALLRLNSMDKITGYIDSVYDVSPHLVAFDTAGYVSVASHVVKERFYHGLSSYTFSDNWIAFVSGKLLWSHLSSIVDPDDILKYSQGLCSQQTIVFMKVLQQKGIQARSIGLGLEEGPGHFLSEVYFRNAWHIYDVSLEPNWNKISESHRSMEYYLTHEDSLYAVYAGNISKPVFDKLVANVKYGKTDQAPAKKMRLFHQLTFALIYLFPVLFASLFLWYYRNSREKSAPVYLEIEEEEEQKEAILV